MEDVLEVYHRDYGEQEVLVCLDETSKQLVGETRQPRPPRPGSPLTYDYAYRRNGVSNRFMLYAPLEGWRGVSVTERHTRRDWAEVVRKLVDEDFPHKERIVLVLDNLNTHHPASLYEAFEPAEAQRIAQRLEIHYTPKHGSWLKAGRRDGRERTGGAGPAVPGPPDTQSGSLGTGNRCVAATAQPGGHPGRLALHYPGRPHQA